MYTNVVQHYNCQPQDNVSTLNITLSSQGEWYEFNGFFMMFTVSSGISGRTSWYQEEPQ